MEELRTFANNIIAIINEIVVPLLLVAAFVIIVFGVFRYFIAGATNDEDRKKGKDLMIWGAIGLVVIFAFWGIVGILDNITGLEGDPEQIEQELPDAPTL